MLGPAVAALEASKYQIGVPCLTAQAELFQISACVTAVRTHPDVFACAFPCNYSSWRDDVLNPPRSALADTNTGAKELDL